MFHKFQIRPPWPPWVPVECIPGCRKSTFHGGVCGRESPAPARRSRPSGSEWSLAGRGRMFGGARSWLGHGPPRRAAPALRAQPSSGGSEGRPMGGVLGSHEGWGGLNLPGSSAMGDGRWAMGDGRWGELRERRGGGIESDGGGRGGTQLSQAVPWARSRFEFSAAGDCLA